MNEERSEILMIVKIMAVTTVVLVVFGILGAWVMTLAIEHLPT